MFRIIDLSLIREISLDKYQIFVREEEGAMSRSWRLPCRIKKIEFGSAQKIVEIEIGGEGLEVPSDFQAGTYRLVFKEDICRDIPAEMFKKSDLTDGPSGHW